MTRIACIALVVIASMVMAIATLLAEDWPQFRGPNCSGVSATNSPLPVHFSATEHVTWSVKLGDGIGCPVVAAGRVFTSAMIDDKTVGLFAFDAVSGQQLWMRSWPIGDVDEIHETNSHAGTTPAADSERVYFYFSTLGMVGLDAKTGADVWRKELPVPYFVFKWGAGMSPVLYKDLVLFCQDDDLHPALYAFDKHTGDLLWKDDRNDMAVNYSHPVICETSSGDEIVVAGTGLLIGYEPKTGKRLWQARTLLRNIKTTPVSRDGIVYVSLQSKGIASQWLASIDQAETGNSDHKVSKDEVQKFFGKRPVPEAFYKKTFERGDLNQDGVLEGRELDLAFLPPGNAAGAAFDAEIAEDEFVLAVRGRARRRDADSCSLEKSDKTYRSHRVASCCE